MQLERIIGLPLSATVTIDETLPYTPQPPILLEEAIQQAIANRADLQAAKAQLRAAEQSEKASKSEYLPTFGVSGTYGLQGTNPNQGLPVYTGAATLSIPIWQGGKAKADVVQANAAVTQRKAELADQQQVVELDVHNAYLDMGTATKQAQVDAPCHTFQSAALRQTNQDRILYADGARLFRREQPIMLFGDCKQFVHAGARYSLILIQHARPVNIVPLLNGTDALRSLSVTRRFVYIRPTFGIQMVGEIMSC